MQVQERLVLRTRLFTDLWRRSVLWPDVPEHIHSLAERLKTVPATPRATMKRLLADVRPGMLSLSEGATAVQVRDQERKHYRPGAVSVEGLHGGEVSHPLKRHFQLLVVHHRFGPANGRHVHRHAETSAKEINRPPSPQLLCEQVVGALHHH